MARATTSRTPGRRCRRGATVAVAALGCTVALAAWRLIWQVRHDDIFEPGRADPTTTVPSNPSGYRAIEDRGGEVIAIPNTINTQSPVFSQAAAACNFR